MSREEERNKLPCVICDEVTNINKRCVLDRKPDKGEPCKTALRIAKRVLAHQKQQTWQDRPDKAGLWWTATYWDKANKWGLNTVRLSVFDFNHVITHSLYSHSVDYIGSKNYEGFSRNTGVTP